MPLPSLGSSRQPRQQTTGRNEVGLLLLLLLALLLPSPGQAFVGKAPALASRTRQISRRPSSSSSSSSDYYGRSFQRESATRPHCILPPIFVSLDVYEYRYVRKRICRFTPALQPPCLKTTDTDRPMS